jgi:thymidylate synthase ThyX
MKLATAVVIADSISDQGIRITTFQLRYWRAIHAELMTHRVFSRNAGSSRARPSKDIIKQVAYDPWGPIVWGLNEPGMQANSVADIDIEMQSLWSWRNAAKRAANSATTLMNLGLHKQIVNRVLEPFTYIDVVVTATDYANWFALRLDKDAQPEIQQLAQVMKDAMDASEPVLLNPGEWHLPYITTNDYAEAQNHVSYVISKDRPETLLDLLKKISAARCARTSYKAFDGKVASIDDDLALFDKLMSGEIKHSSPTEHQATPDYTNYWDGEIEFVSPWLHGNFKGWVQYRKTIPNEFIEG